MSAWTKWLQTATQSGSPTRNGSDRSSTPLLPNYNITNATLSHSPRHGRSASGLPISPTSTPADSFLHSPKSRAPSVSTLVQAFPTVARHALRGISHIIIPSFLHPSVGIGHSHTPSNILNRSPAASSTAYLDGLRGTAALLVSIYHFLYAYFPSLEYSFLHTPNDTNPLQLPIIRLYMCGASMVSIFFVISGFALSYKPLLQIRRNNDPSAALQTLSSSTFRRAIRLFLPTLISILTIGLVIQAGGFTWSAKYAKRGNGTIPGWREEDPPILSSFRRQMTDSFWAWARMSNPFIWKEYFVTYDLHLWTIPVEFRCSMVVFLAVMGLSRVKGWVRMLCLGLGSWWCLIYMDRWDVALFLAGVVIAELTVVRQTSMAAAGDSDVVGPLSRAILKRLSLLLVLLVGLYIASIPSHDPANSIGYRALRASVPRTVKSKDRFWPSIAAVIIVLTISASTPNFLQRPFTSSFAQYLGKISYALYLVHGPVYRSLGFWSVVNTWRLTGRDSGTKYIAGVAAGGVLVFAVVFWLSDIYWRVVDVSCVKFARRVEIWCLAKTADTQRKGEKKRKWLFMKA